MMKYQSSYYLFYSANWWESSSYGIGYAVCSSPAGPCTKKTLDGPLHSVKVAHSRLIKPAELRTIDAEFRLN